MKITITKILLFSLIIQINCFAQNKISEEIILNYDFNSPNTAGTSDDKITNNSLFRDASINSYYKIFISDAGQKKIIVFEKNGEFDTEINIDNIIKRDFNQVKITHDEEDNLYVLFLEGEFFRGLIKYSKNNVLSNEFELEKPFPFERTTKISIKNNNIYIGTFPSAMDPRYIELGIYFVYDKLGKYLGRTDCDMVDKNGRIYMSKSDKAKFYIEIFEKPKENKILLTRNLTKIDEIIIPNLQPGKISRQDYWYNIGIDNMNNIFISNEKDIISFNFDTKKRKKTSYKLKNKDVFLLHSTRIKCNFAGNLFMLAAKGEAKGHPKNKAIILPIN